MKNIQRIEEIKDLLNKNQSMTAKDLAIALGISRENVYVLLRRSGIEAKRATPWVPAKRGETSRKIADLIASSPDMTAAEIAKKLGVSRQNVYNTASRANIKIKRHYLRSSTTPQRIWTTPFGHIEKLSSHFIGGTSEMYACADLLSKGIPVYRAITFVSSADLVVEILGRLYRVEVKSARRSPGGKLQYCAPFPERRDILALAEKGGGMTYIPTLETFFDIKNE